MSDILRNLTKAIAERNEISIIENLQVLSAHTDADLNTVDLINNLLKFDNNINIIKSTTELTAELVRKESNRKVCTDETLINDLINLLDNNDTDIIVNSIRALGNICYENENACNIIENIGTNKLLTILKGNHRVDKGNVITTKMSGLLLNLFNMNFGLIRSSMKNGLLPIMEDILIMYSQEFDNSQTLLTFQISILNIIEHHLSDFNVAFTPRLCKALIDIFKQSKIPEISVPCLEIFHGQCEQEDIKSLLAQEGVCEFLFELIEKYRHEVNDDDSRDILKMACDFIVVVLTGDDCMNLLYNNGQGQVYKNTLTWLDSDDQDLLSTGILAIGNFARKDTHCIELVNDGISKKLLDILRRFNTSTNMEDVKIQHALLSTLKNLAIPQINKAKLLQEGLIEIIYPMIKIDQYLVIFKLLGTFRMVIDGQESTALDLISRIDFVERLVYWCYNSDHLGVSGEVPRLLSWLIKQCRSSKPFKLLLRVADSIKCIVEMISSNHAVMQNEAFYALSLLYVGFSRQSSDVNIEEEENSLDTFNMLLIDADIGKNINFILTKYAEKMDTPTSGNLLVLLEEICKSSRIVEHLKGTELKTLLPKLRENPNTINYERLDRIRALVDDF